MSGLQSKISGKKIITKLLLKKKVVTFGSKRSCGLPCFLIGNHKGGKHRSWAYLAASRCGQMGEAWLSPVDKAEDATSHRIPSSPLGNPLGFFEKKRSGIFSCGVYKICILWHINRLRYSSIFRCATVGLAKWLRDLFHWPQPKFHAEYLWPTLPPHILANHQRLWRRLPIESVAWNSKLQPTPLR